MAGPQQGHQLFAGAGTVVAVEGEPLEAFFPRGTGWRLRQGSDRTRGRSAVSVGSTISTIIATLPNWMMSRE